MLKSAEFEDDEVEMTALPARRQVPSDDVDYPRVALISTAHLSNDLYGNLITSLTPYLVLRGDISISLAGLVLLIYLVGSSILQPLFGLLADQSGRRYFAVLGPLWIGVAASLFGWATNSWALLGLAGLGGIGTAAFHPQAASMVNKLSKRSKGWTMSLFSTGGSIGFAFGPLVAALFAGVGLQWTVLVFLPGVALTFLLAMYAPYPEKSGENVRFPDLRRHVSRVWRALAVIVSVIAIRSGVQYALIIFLPLYFHARGYPSQFGSYFAFALSISGAAGGLLGGYLSDRCGRKVVVVASLAVSSPLIFLSLLTPPLLGWPLIALSGAALLASNSVTVVQGQELLPASPGIASGLTLGLAFGLAGVTTSALTLVSSHIGVTATIFVVPLLAMACAVLAMLVPSRTEPLPLAEGISTRNFGMSGGE